MDLGFVLLHLVCLVAGLIILIEADNKIRRTDVSRKTLSALPWLERFVSILRAVAWLCLFLVGGGVIFAPELDREFLMLGMVLGAVASACLIVKTRLEEYRPKPDGAHVETDPFGRTHVMRDPFQQTMGG